MEIHNDVWQAESLRFSNGQIQDTRTVTHRRLADIHRTCIHLHQQEGTRRHQVIPHQGMALDIRLHQLMVILRLTHTLPTFIHRLILLRHMDGTHRKVTHHALASISSAC